MLISRFQCFYLSKHVIIRNIFIETPIPTTTPMTTTAMTTTAKKGNVVPIVAAGAGLLFLALLGAGAAAASSGWNTDIDAPDIKTKQ